MALLEYPLAHVEMAVLSKILKMFPNIKKHNVDMEERQK